METLTTVLHELRDGQRRFDARGLRNNQDVLTSSNRADPGEWDS